MYNTIDHDDIIINMYKVNISLIYTCISDIAIRVII